MLLIALLLSAKAKYEHRFPAPGNAGIFPAADAVRAVLFIGAMPEAPDKSVYYLY